MADATMKCEVTLCGGGAGFGHEDYDCGQPARIHVNGFPCCAHHFEEYEQEGLIESVSVPAESAAPPATETPTDFVPQYSRSADGKTVIMTNYDEMPPVSSGLGQSTCAGTYQGTIGDLVHRLEVCVAEEQEQPLPRNHFVAVFCDVIRYMRDEGAKPFATVGEPAEALAQWAQTVIDAYLEQDESNSIEHDFVNGQHHYRLWGDETELFSDAKAGVARAKVARAISASDPSLPKEPGT